MIDRRREAKRHRYYDLLNFLDVIEKEYKMKMSVHSSFKKHVPLLMLILLAACGGQSSMNADPQFAPSPVAAAPANPDTIFPKTRDSYTIEKKIEGYLVKDKSTSGTKLLPITTTSLSFSDLSVNLTISDKAKTISSQDLSTLIELYIAFFNRVPEADGLSYWINQRTAGMTFESMAESFYAAALQYSEQTGYSSTMSNNDFVKLIYKNVLGRTGTTAPPEQDINYWSNDIASGKVSKGNLVISMLNSAHSFANDPDWGWVPQLLDNKKEIGNEFAVNLGINYLTTQESITKTTQIVSTITPNNTKIAYSMLNYERIGGSLPVFAKAFIGTVKLSNFGVSTRVEGSSVFTKCNFYLTVLVEGNRLIKFTGWRGVWSNGHKEGGTSNFVVDPTKYDEVLWANNIEIAAGGPSAPVAFSVDYLIDYAVESMGQTGTVTTRLYCRP